MKKFLRQTVAVLALVTALTTSEAALAQTNDAISPTGSPAAVTWQYLWDTNSQTWYRQLGVRGATSTAPLYTQTSSSVRYLTATVHAAGSAICVSTPCGTQAITVLRNPGTASVTSYGTITSIQFMTSNITGATNLYPRIYFYNAVPTLASTGDTVAFAPLYADINVTSGTPAKYLGYVDCPTPQVNADNAFFNCPLTNYPLGMPINAASNGQIYFIFTQSPLAGASYTSAAAYYNLYISAQQN